MRAAFFFAASMAARPDTSTDGRSGKSAIKRSRAPQRLLASGPVTMESRGVDKYGRTVALVRVGGYDVAPSLRAEGVARGALTGQDTGGG